MKTTLITTCITILLTLLTLNAEEDHGTHAGRAELSKLLLNAPLRLENDHKASLTLQLGVEDINHPKTHNVRYNSFTYNGSGFSEPDNSAPSLSALFNVIPNGRDVSVTHIAFLDPNAPRLIAQLRSIDSWEEFSEQFPHAETMATEGDSLDDPQIYRYIWFHSHQEGSLVVYWVEAERTPNSFKLWAWNGELVQLKKTIK